MLFFQLGVDQFDLHNLILYIAFIDDSALISLTMTSIAYALVSRK